MTNPRRPFRLRAMIDLELTEAEYGLVAQAFLPKPPPERALELLVVDLAHPDPEGNGGIVAQVAARPARLELDPAATRKAPDIPESLEDAATAIANATGADLDELLEFARQQVARQQEARHDPPVD